MGWNATYAYWLWIVSRLVGACLRRNEIHPKYRPWHVRQLSNALSAFLEDFRDRSTPGSEEHLSRNTRFATIVRAGR